MSEGNMERDYAVRHHLRGYPFGELKTASGDESAYQFAGIPIKALCVLHSKSLSGQAGMKFFQNFKQRDTETN